MEFINTMETLLGEVLSLPEQMDLVRALSPAMNDGKALADIVQYLRTLSVKIDLKQTAIDIVGTGADGLNTLNFSTLSAILVSASGVPVAKHGAKASTSRCGSFDLLQNLEVFVPDSPAEAVRCFNAHNLVFLFGAYFNPVLKKMAEVRRALAALGEKTVFNCLGPLLNPASVKHMLVGVYSPQLIPAYASALQNLGVSHAYVVHSGGLDEFSVVDTNHYARLSPKGIEYGSIEPEALGFQRASVDTLKGADAAHNAKESRLLLKNELFGPKRDTLILNAAMALHVFYEFNIDLKDAVARVEATLSQGLAYQKLLQLQEKDSSHAA